MVKKDVVSLKYKASRILQDFYKKDIQQNEEHEKQRLISAAVKLIKCDIKEELRSKLTPDYPNPENFETEQKCLDYLPTSLKQLLCGLISGKKDGSKVSGIGHAIMQCVAPRSACTPLQLAVGVQVHRQYGSRNLVDVLHRFGFCCSYSDVLNYSRSAAFHLGTDLSVSHGSFVQYIGDNVDHNLKTLDGSNTFHGMGIVATITPGIKSALMIPKGKVPSSNILSKSHINITYFKSKMIPKETKFTKLMLNSTGNDRTHNIDILWKIAWFLKPCRPL